ncbi:hypothetical protein QS468_31220 [Bacillus subtilis]|nr:hypothetical protein [Pseudomonas sp. A29(2023)]MDL5597214.1 hypothetical protein [Bacillus subtilis]
MTKRIAGEIIESEATSREGTVYITNKYVYKKTGVRSNPYDLLESYKFAELSGVPVPDTCKITTTLQSNSHEEFFSGIRMKRAHGRFFQLSKSGGESILCNEIAKFRNRELLKTLIAGLNNASKIGVTDPQGFVSVDSNPPLTFIDLHYTKHPNHITFSTALNRATQKLEELEIEIQAISNMI